MINPNVNNQVVIEISDACQSFECAFRDGVSEKLFNDLSDFNRVPGWSIEYGVNRHQGGLDKSVVEIHHNRAKKTKDAAEYLETSLRDVLLFREILWKRAISGGSLEGNHVSDVFD